MKRRAEPVTGVSFTAAPRFVQDTGLLGWVSFRLADLRIDCVALRRTAKGNLALAFPRSSPGRGMRHRAPVRPAGTESLRRIEDAVFAALGVTREGGEA